MDLHESVDNNDDAIASDSDDDLDANQVRMNRRKSSIVNENEPSTSKQDVLNGQKSLIGKALLDDKKTLVDISIGKGALGKDATWDEFPNGRFGDSNSPAYVHATIMSLFVNDDDDNETYVDEGINDVILQQSQTPSLKEEANEEQDPTRPSIPVVFEDPPDITPIYESKEVGCLLPLLFQQEVVEDMLSKDGLLVLGRGLGWEIIAANLLYALSSPSISLVTGDRQESKRSLVLLVNAKEEENIKLSDILTELHWANTTSINRSSPENEGARLSDEYGELTDLDRSPLTIIGGDITSADKRRRTYDCGGIVSVTSRVLVVDLLSGILSPHDITGLFILHAERIKETSNESFIVNLYRDTNDWGY
ncbi:hypothetical protein QCA50_015618 [Cerrena zonata]|uniref:Uncharacterized protein n=1 Tax=Cerrena zonata TaxID=2478898 RepID=A0AAW0FKU3_9APHY